MSNNVDYLYEDPVISNQKYVCISILTPKNFKETTTMHTLKVRGSFDTYEEAAKRAEFLRNIDSNINVYVGEVGKWLPFDDDPEKAKDHDYQNKRLNEMMKGYLENQEKAKEFHEQRKNEMIMKTHKENEEKIARNKARQARRDAGETVDDEAEEKVFLESNQRPDTNQNIVTKVKGEDKKKVLLEKEEAIKEKEKEIKETKADVAKTQEEYNKYQQKNEKVKKELEDAKKVFEEMLAASKDAKSNGKIATAGSMN
jgi:DNA repair exonuclease SbcCD ATPase subunit